jgi:TRAP-type C4-dicarboxylate transport system substrate-binding protein
MKMLSKIKLAAALGALASFCASPAISQDKTNFKFAFVNPQSHYIWLQGGKHFVDSVIEKSGGAVNVTVFPGGQLGTDYLTTLQSGIADLAILVPSFTPRKLPLTSVAELPIAFENSCAATQSLWQIAKPGEMLDKAEYKPQGVRVLFAAVVPAYKLLTVSKPITKLEDVAGLKIKASGGAQSKTARALGAIPVQITGPETYDALSRGTADGALWPFHGAPAFDLDKVFKHGAEGPQLGTAAVMFVISEKKWNALPKALQSNIIEAAAETQTYLCGWLEAEETRVRDYMKKEVGYKGTTIEGDELKKWQERTDTVSTEWATEMDGQGRPGTQLLEAFRKNASN